MSDGHIIEKISELNGILKDLLLMNFTMFPDPLEKEDKPVEEKITEFIGSLAETEKALDTFGKWIKTRQKAYEYIKTFFKFLRAAISEKGDIESRMRLIIIPLLKDISHNIDIEKKLGSELKEVFPKIRKVAEGHDTTLKRISTYHEIIGYDSRECISEVESFFKAIVNGRFKEASNLLEKIKARCEKLRENVEKSCGKGEEITAR
ncbi:MAG: hypothetical protein ACFE7E_05970 [Candidatus Hodarchaeota archaeon]